jgi:diacylglycerol kinase family enzyme
MRIFKNSVLVLMFLFFLSSFTSLHKYYVSVTDVEYVAQKQVVQIISRLFVDDFEKVLKERYEQPIQLADNSSRIYVEKYFSKKMLVTINGKVESIKLIGTEIEDDMLHCYFEIENISNIKTIQITNKLFFEMFYNQQNITHLKVNDRKKSFLCIKDNSKGLLKF